MPSTEVRVACTERWLDERDVDPADVDAASPMAGVTTPRSWAALPHASAPHRRPKRAAGMCTNGLPAVVGSPGQPRSPTGGVRGFLLSTRAHIGSPNARKPYVIRREISAWTCQRSGGHMVGTSALSCAFCTDRPSGSGSVPRSLACWPGPASARDVGRREVIRTSSGWVCTVHDTFATLLSTRTWRQQVSAHRLSARPTHPTAAAPTHRQRATVLRRCCC